MVRSFFSFLFIILLFLSSLGVVIFRLQNPEFVLKAARSVNLYDRLANNIQPFIDDAQLKQTGLDRTDIVEVIQVAIDAEEFYGILETSLNAYLPWLSGKTDQVNFSYDLTAAKQRLADSLTARILTKYNELPTCNSTQLRTWSFKDSLPECQLAPGAVQAKNIDSQASMLASTTVGDLPDSITAAEPSDKLIQQRNLIAKGFKGIYLLWGITALLIAIYLLIFGSSGLISLAVSFLFVGALEIAFSLIGWDWITRTIGDSVGGSSEAKSFLPLTMDLAAVIIEALKTTLGNISIGFLLAGSVSLVAGIITKIHQPKVLEKVK